uniref:acetate--CoA ligase (ADP-forming) n=1 Tax=Candidatus Methanogaster sp. ANME-2c ERB4 TaxID=2759911 RepID=A0A7G9YP88_9EURY|nr:acetate--CoA ligase [ADP-forming] [Methanosarcinales archaeon ANME-2c ERB4]QNO49961.1 acetate--CoA ligase [ADP-forming] [Methanosarcinales archaeon ANME-2c ERB4]
MLSHLLEPDSIALIGASSNREKWGYRILNNIMSGGYAGSVYPVNPNEDEILGMRCYHSVLDLPRRVDLGMIVLPAETVPLVLKECGRKGVGGVVIVSAGFSEVGNRALENEVSDIAKEYDMRMIGPNTFGFINTHLNLNASIIPQMPEKGGISFVTQSGTFGLALVDWAVSQQMGLHLVVGVGNKADVDDSDLLEYFNADRHTKTIMMYIEGIENGRRFIDVASRIRKPVIALKTGRSQAGRRATLSHTGSLAGTDRIYDGAFKQAGIIRAKTIEELFDSALALSISPPADDGIGIVSNGGGAAILAADLCDDLGLHLPDLSESTERKLKDVLPEIASPINPVDTAGDASYEMFRDVTNIVLSDPGINALLVIYVHAEMVDPCIPAEAVIDARRGCDKPVLTSWIGGKGLGGAVKLLNENRIPHYPMPERAVVALNNLVRYKRILQNK